MIESKCQANEKLLKVTDNQRATKHSQSYRAYSHQTGKDQRKNDADFLRDVRNRPFCFCCLFR